MFDKLFEKRSYTQDKLNRIFCEEYDEINDELINNNNYNYYNCIDELCNQIAKIDINVYKTTEDKKEIVQSTLNTLLSLRANRYQTSFSLIYNLMYSVFKNGIGAIYIKRDKAGFIKALYNVDNLSVNQEINVINDIDRINYVGSIFNVSYNFLEEELCIIRSNEDILQNRSRSNFKDLLDVNNKQLNLLKKIFSGENLADNIVIQQNVTTDVFKNKENVEKVINSYLNLLKKDGMKKEKIKVIPYGYSLSTISPKLTDNQFLEIKQDTKKEIRENLGLYLNSTDEEELNFLQNKVIPIVSKIEKELNWKLLTEEQRKTGISIEFNLNNFIKISAEKHVNILCNLVRNGIVTINEARLELNKNKTKNGDSVLINSGVYQLDMLNQIVQAKYSDTQVNTNDINIDNKLLSKNVNSNKDE